MGEGDLDFDWGSLFSGNDDNFSGADLSGVDLSDLADMGLTGVGDLGNLNLDQTDFSGLANIDLSQLGEMGLTGVDGVDLSSLLGTNPGDADQAAPPANIAELLSSMNASSPENLANTDWNALANEGLTDEQIAKRNDLMSYAQERNQDFGGADVNKYFDEYDKNMSDIMQNKGGFTSQWQDVGGNKVMVNDDPQGGSTATVFNPTTGQTSYLTEEQTKALIDNGTLNTKGSGYVAATGGTGYVPGGGKTFTNADGTKTVITTDGKVLTVTKDGQVINTGKTVNVNDKTLETKTIKEIIDNSKNTTTPGKNTTTPAAAAKPAANNNNMLMMLLALMAMMNKGGGSSTGSGGTIPSLQANRSQLPYGPVAGAAPARPGAGGVNYFSPTTYTQKAAGGGMMYGGGGISDLGGYSDGGRLLKGPGDGVSDSIPATIGGKQPARLATGEFVVPARIVSELGNGSTDAGAQKLYAMMDRVQKARRKTKNVAADTKAHKYLPA
jgi:hypothetical protein